ncbi:heavy metal translocating P-type ATPase [Aquisphaera insulae]|uniref:heavy metal translocating P-type ATPase n=1 Tax=Aquisphaera insulae TaxID=2712864 RepID=UPI0013EC115F|nr:heavy metal translocating P-type ATPase [Aquisphaera insulae]
MDIAITFPSRGQIRLGSQRLFSEPGNEDCRRFLERVFHAPEITDVTIDSGRKGGELPFAELRFCPSTHSLPEVVRRISSCLTSGRPPGSGPDGEGTGNRGVAIRSVTPVRTETGQIRFFRYGSVVTNWEVKHEIPGRLRLRNPAIHRRGELCQAIERELMSVLGVDSYRTNPLTSTVLVQYDPAELTRDQIIEIIDGALHSAERPEKPDRADVHLPLCTLSLPVAAVAQFAVPALLPAAALLFAYTSIPTFKEARAVLFEERRLGVDVLDSIVVIGCLGTMSIFPGAVLCWCLSFGRVLVKRTQDNSKKLLLNAFGKQPRFVWLYRDGVEVQVSLDRLEAGDTIVVNTGEVVPVDGIITEGLAMIDQHALTGESTPAEKGVGDRVFASTLMVAGKVLVSVEKSGSETASAKISQILNDTAGYKLSSQHKGERLADRAVIPTLTIGAVGMATMGPAGAVAVLNSDFGTGIRMAAPLAMLSSLALAASKGILVKDGRALELMNEVDTVLFDKTGTLTRERPEVGRVLAAEGLDRDQILLYAAAAEKKFHHPIALAILHKAKELGLELPETDETQYKVGYGITVQIDGHLIRVGSKRFMELENLPISDSILEALEECHREGHTMVMVGVDDRVGGAIELHAAVRPEVREIVQGLRDRGIKHIAIISGDHEAPTKKLAESLGMDRYFAQVLPADKADHVATLQAEGKKVCFVGDGINDSIALKKANVSISLRGASSIATDTAHIVFMEQGLTKLCELRDIARDLDRNVKRSWSMILAPNIACILGVFTMGFGIMASVVTNNVAAIGALANGMMPLRKIAEIEAEKKHEQELRRAYGLARKTP